MTPALTDKPTLPYTSLTTIQPASVLVLTLPKAFKNDTRGLRKGVNHVVPLAWPS